MDIFWNYTLQLPILDHRGKNKVLKFLEDCGLDCKISAEIELGVQV